MKVNLLNRKVLAVVCSLVLFVGMSMMTDAQQSKNKKKKNEQQAKMQKVEQKDRTRYDQRLTKYRQNLNQLQKINQQRMAQLQREKRMSQYRYQQQYLTQLLQQQKLYENARMQNYQNDHFFLTTFDRRYNRGGIFYETNQYGVEHLQQAVQNGYAQGFQAGMADRQDGWRSNVGKSVVYQDSIYGYNGYYVSLDDYRHYFREGFRRGYTDGYNKSYQYGRFADGKYSILDSILAEIIPFEMLR